MKTHLCILFAILNLSLVWSQSKGDTEINTLFSRLIKTMNSLGNNGPKYKVLSLYDDEYKGNTVYVNLSGALVRKNYDKKDISSQLDDIADDDNYNFQLTLDKIVFQSQKESAGIISAIVNFESFINKKSAEKGKMLMDMVGIRGKDKKWKIVQNNMVRVSEAKDIGECVCYMFGNGSTKFITEVYFPDGLEYSQKLEAFRITRKDGVRIIKSNDNEFSWKSNGDVYLENKVIGKSEDVKKVVELAVKEIFKDSCAKMSFN